MQMFDEVKEAYTFDDVLLIPNYSNVLPSEVCVKTKLTQQIDLNIPLISASMDTVTESAMAIAMALVGGIGIIHKNMELNKQAEQIQTVKNFSFDQSEFPNATVGPSAQLLCGAAIGPTPDMLIRLELLVNAGVDVVIIDTAHGHSKGVLESVSVIKTKYPKLSVIAGNIATPEATNDLIEMGADAVKVGIGPGSICTTRIICGVGVPQFSAIVACSHAAKMKEIPVIADGGIRYSGDIVKALAAGASTCMIGSLFAGTNEAPGTAEVIGGISYKNYRGMGSLAAMVKGSSDRYFQSATSKFVPEGVEGLIPCCGAASEVIYQLIGGLKSGMGYVGAKTLVELYEKSKFVKQSALGLRESHPHNITIKHHAPNYKEGAVS